MTDIPRTAMMEKLDTELRNAPRPISVTEILNELEEALEAAKTQTDRIRRHLSLIKDAISK